MITKWTFENRRQDLHAFHGLLWFSFALLSTHLQEYDPRMNMSLLDSELQI